MLDRYLPEREYDVATIRHRLVEADPGTTYDAIREADLLDAGRLVRTLGRLRIAPTALLERAEGTRSEPVPRTLSVADLEAADGWVRLAESPGREVVLGTIGRFRHSAYEWRAVDPEAFADVRDPGHVKLAVSFSIRPHGKGRTLASVETRVAATDADSGRRLRRYWRLLGPVAGCATERALSRIAATAEGRAE